MKSKLFSAFLLLGAILTSYGDTPITVNSISTEQTVAAAEKLGGTASLVEKGKIQIATPENKLIFLPLTESFAVKPLSVIFYKFTASGTGKAGFVIDVYAQNGTQIGYQSVNKPLTEQGETFQDSIRIRETYQQQIPAKINIRLQIDKNTKATVSGFAFEYREEIPNLTLVPTTRTDWAGEYYQSLAQVADSKNTPIMFLGDSITICWMSSSTEQYPGGKESWKEFFEPRNAVNFGVSGDTIENVLWRVTEGKQLAGNPKIIVLLIGTNNLHGRPIVNGSEEIAQGIINLVDVIQKQLPESRILLMGLFPREGDFPISAINAMLAKHDWNSKVMYRDYSEVLLRGQGTISREIFRDGLHLSPAGYALLAKPLLEDIKKLEEAAKTIKNGAKCTTP